MDSAGGGNYPGTPATFSCANGYYLEGSVTLPCGTDGQYSPLPTCPPCTNVPHCSDVRCTGSVDQACSTKSSCDQGFRTNKQCAAESCEDLPVPHSDHSAGSTNGPCSGVTDSVCQIQCREGYDHDSSQQGSTTCEATGEFAAFECAPKMCTPLTIQHTKAAGGSTTCSGVTEDVCKYRCADGCTDSPRGTGQTVCGNDGAFDPASCVAQACDPKTIEHSDKSSDPCSGSTDSKCTVNCVAGYTGDGKAAGKESHAIACLPDHSFEPFSCLAVPCSPKTISHSDHGSDSPCQASTDGTCEV